MASISINITSEIDITGADKEGDCVMVNMYEQGDTLFIHGSIADMRRLAETILAKLPAPQPAAAIVTADESDESYEASAYLMAQREW